MRQLMEHRLVDYVMGARPKAYFAPAIIDAAYSGEEEGSAPPSSSRAARRPLRSAGPSS